MDILKYFVWSRQNIFVLSRKKIFRDDMKKVRQYFAQARQKNFFHQLLYQFVCSFKSSRGISLKFKSRTTDDVRHSILGKPETILPSI